MNINTHLTSDANLLESIGLSPWAGIMGADSANVFALAASISSGAASLFAHLEFPWGIVPLPRSHVVVPDNQGTLPFVLDHLTSPVVRANSQILANMSGINPAGLRHLMYGSFAGDPEKANPHGNIEGSVLKTLRDGPAFDPRSSRVATGESDLIPDPKLCRLEGITRPAVLLESPLPSRLGKLLQGCHRGHALVIGIPFDSLPSTNKPAKELADLLTFMRGTEIEIPQPKYPVAFEHNRAVGIHTILKANPNLLRQLLHLLAPALEDSVLLSNTPPEFAISPDSAYFSTLYSKVISRTIIMRRNSVPMMASFTSPSHACKFQKRFLDHQAACDACDVTIGSSVRNLPLTLAWFLLILREHIRGRALPTDDAIIDSVFAASATLLDRHTRAMTDLHHAAQHDELLKRVKDIVRKVAEKQFVTESQLARSFDDQRVGLYRPLVQQLLEQGVLSVTPEAKLRIGPCRLEDALPKLLLTSNTTL